MILVDANLLLFAYNADAPEHARARAWLESCLSAGDWLGLSWLTLWAFLRISTNVRLFPRPLSAQDAFRIVGGWIELPHVVVVQPGPRHLAILEKLVQKGQAAGRLLTDAALAAMAIEHGATLVSTDQDFSRFPGLQWLNPL